MSAPINALGSMAIAAQRPRPRLRLVLVDRDDCTCGVCGRPVPRGTEATTWIGTSLAHTGCGDIVGGPRGF